MAGLVQTVAPATEPVTTTQAKAHCRVDISTDDTLIATLITVARRYVEQYTGRQLVSATWRLTLDDFSEPPYAIPNCKYGGPAIWLPKPPLVSVTSIIYTDTDGVSQTLSSSLYRVDASREPGWITPAYGQVWPTPRVQTSAIAITYVAGYTTVPETLCQAMLLLIGHLYENREAVVTGTITSKLPLAVESLLGIETTGIYL